VGGEEVKPEEIVRLAKRYETPSIAYTYTEPTIFYEYAFDIARLAHKEGLRNIFVSNGFISGKALKKIAPYLDAMNMDFKMGKKEDYVNYCMADAFEVVKDTARRCKEFGIHLEVTTLVIPGVNDGKEGLEEIFSFVCEEIGKDTPLHISRFYPHYKMQDVEPTPLDVLINARKIAEDLGLCYVYIGNVPGGQYEDTYCPSCKKVLIRRDAFILVENRVKAGRCPYCNQEILMVYG
jgi:pyruvate formate lyase activating enzyme